MFETAELGRTMPKSVYKKNAPVLRQELLDLQVEIRGLDHSQIILVFAGVDGAGKGETVNLLNEWMDPRWLMTRAFDEPADVERERPEFWRYWLALPPRGRIGMFLGSWYSQPVLDRVYGTIDDRAFDTKLDRIIGFENALADDNAVIIKFWMHLSRDAQQERLKSLEADPLERARVTRRDWKHWELYDDFIAAAERVIMRTSTGKAPWNVVEGVDPNYRAMTVATVLRDTLQRKIDEIRLELRVKNELTALAENGVKKGKRAKKTKGKNNKKNRVDERDALVAAAEKADAGKTASAVGAASGDAGLVTVLSRLDMNQTIGKKAYTARLKEEQARLHLLHRRARREGVSAILVFEGPDASGKGGAIRRLNAALDARNYQVYGFSAPSDEESAQHYLWRFWRHLSRAGRMTIFDRSWYGRVLVERVEGFASEDEWRRAYAELNDFEAQLIEHGIVIVKYWLHITKNEQLARFKLREQTPYKRWKLTEEDWRNRDKWTDYELAVNDMVQHTSTKIAPWTLVEGNNKHFARVKVITTLCDRLAAALGEPAPAARAKAPRAGRDAPPAG